MAKYFFVSSGKCSLINRLAQYDKKNLKLLYDRTFSVNFRARGIEKTSISIFSLKILRICLYLSTFT